MVKEIEMREDARRFEVASREYAVLQNVAGMLRGNMATHLEVSRSLLDLVREGFSLIEMSMTAKSCYIQLQNAHAMIQTRLRTIEEELLTN